MLFPREWNRSINQFSTENKITQATLNISPNKLSQSFGDYSVYVKSKENNIYKI